MSVVARCADLLRKRLAIGCKADALLRVNGGLGGRGSGSDVSSGSASRTGDSGCRIGGGIGGSMGCEADSPDDALVGRWGFAGVGGRWGGPGAGIAGWAAATGIAAAVGDVGGAAVAIDLVMRIVVAGASSSSSLLLE